MLAKRDGSLVRMLISVSARPMPLPTLEVADSVRLVCGHSLICIATIWHSMLTMPQVRWQMPNPCRCGLCPTANLVCTTWRWQCAITMRALHSPSTVTSVVAFGKCLIAPHRSSSRWMARTISTSVPLVHSRADSCMSVRCVHGFHARWAASCGLATTTPIWWRSLLCIAALPSLRAPTTLPVLTISHSVWTMPSGCATG